MMPREIVFNFVNQKAYDWTIFEPNLFNLLKWYKLLPGGVYRSTISIESFGCCCCCWFFFFNQTDVAPSINISFVYHYDYFLFHRRFSYLAMNNSDAFVVFPIKSLDNTWDSLILFCFVGAAGYSRRQQKLILYFFRKCGNKYAEKMF